jgi:hypothetical protein
MLVSSNIIFTPGAAQHNAIQFKATRLFGGLLGQQNGVDVGQDTSRGNGDSSQQAVQFLVILHSKSDVTGDNTRLLVVTGGVSGKLQDFGAKVLKHSRKVDGGSGSHTGGVLSLTKVSSDTTDGELQTGLGRCSGALLFAAASLSFS